MTKTTLHKDENEQYKTTFPKNLAESMGLERGEKLEWKIKSSNRLEIVIEQVVEE